MKCFNRKLLDLKIRGLNKEYIPPYHECYRCQGTNPRCLGYKSPELSVFDDPYVSSGEEKNQ
jgi:hypothetical protein